MDDDTRARAAAFNVAEGDGRELGIWERASGRYWLADGRRAPMDVDPTTLPGAFELAEGIWVVPVDEASAPSLSPRQAEVARLVVEGMTDGAVAEALGISAHTVRTHLRAVYERLGCANRVELVEAWSQRTSEADAARSAELGGARASRRAAQE